MENLNNSSENVQRDTTLQPFIIGVFADWVMTQRP